MLQLHLQEAAEESSGQTPQEQKSAAQEEAGVVHQNNPLSENYSRDDFPRAPLRLRGGEPPGNQTTRDVLSSPIVDAILKVWLLRHFQVPARHRRRNS